MEISLAISIFMTIYQCKQPVIVNIVTLCGESVASTKCGEAISLRKQVRYSTYCIWNPTCVYCLVNKGETSVKSNNIKKVFVVILSLNLPMQRDYHMQYCKFMLWISSIKKIWRSLLTKKASSMLKAFGTYD
jgi:hypothetical protein